MLPTRLESSEQSCDCCDHTWDRRLAELTRPAVLVLDDFGMRELTASQADDLYELITDRAGKSLILRTS